MNEEASIFSQSENFLEFIIRFNINFILNIRFWTGYPTEFPFCQQKSKNNSNEMTADKAIKNGVCFLDYMNPHLVNM